MPSLERQHPMPTRSGCPLVFFFKNKTEIDFGCMKNFQIVTGSLIFGLNLVLQNSQYQIDGTVWQSSIFPAQIKIPIHKQTLLLINAYCFKLVWNISKSDDISLEFSISF